MSLTSIIAASRRRVAAPGYLVAENFDATGTPSGWTWDGVGTCDFDAASSGPQGGQCLRIQSSTNNSLGGAQHALGASYPELWIYFQYQGSTGNNWNRSLHLTNVSQFYFGGGRLWGGASGPDVPELASTSWLHIWQHLTPTQQDVFISTTAVRPATPAATRAGSFAAVTRLCFSCARNANLHMDALRVSVSEIGSNPV